MNEKVLLGVSILVGGAFISFREVPRPQEKPIHSNTREVGQQKKERKARMDAADYASDGHLHKASHTRFVGPRVSCFYCWLVSKTTSSLNHSNQ